MNTNLVFLFVVTTVAAGAVAPVSAAVRYVNVANTSPAPPYTSWATAALTIQEAIDAAAAGDEIVVTNGVYATGGRAVDGTMTNRVAVTKPLTVRSVNGSELTVIAGYRGTSYGDGAVRCVYLTNSAALVGFTLTNGATRSDGDPIRERSGGGVWCESVSAVVSNCTLAGNTAQWVGGGVYSGTLNNCRLTGNFTSWSFGTGGGAYNCTLSNCTVAGNFAHRTGGGAVNSTLNNCTLTGNSAGQSGQAEQGINRIYWAGQGGGASECTLNNCMLTGNSAGSGGGAADSTLNNCIVYYNTATLGLGPNYYGGALNYCCTIPLPSAGAGNIMDEPQLASSSHLSARSPCRAAGSASFVSGVDIDGEGWANPPSIGCDEYHVGAVTRPITVEIETTYTNIASGFVMDFRAQIDGTVTVSRWEFGDGTVVSNQPYSSHSWAGAGNYPVVLRAYNETYPQGVSPTVMVHVLEQPVHYVSLNSASPAAPYRTWASAARNIQDAVDAAMLPGALVLVTNGIYQVGGRAVSAVYPYGTPTNRVAVTKPLTVRSMNGPDATVIRGFQVPGTTNGDSAVRCVYLGNGAALVGFTLTNGATARLGDDSQGGGGGVWCESTSAAVSNCMITGNSAYFGGGGAACGNLRNCTLTANSSLAGGGAYYGTLSNCTLTGNHGVGAINCTLNNCTLTGNQGSGAYGSTLNGCTLTGNSATEGGGARVCTLNNCALTGNVADSNGGGASGSTLNNCTITGNSARNSGGGTHDSTLNNCIVYYNTTTLGVGSNYSGGILNYSCTTPLPTNGVGNITTEPQLASARHLSARSPCRAAGNASFASGVDIDGETWANPPSIGCDEYHVGAVAGPLAVEIEANYTNVATGFVVVFRAQVTGRVSDSRWEFGDGTVVSNQPYSSHSWTAAGNYPVVLRAYNETYPQGASATMIVHVVELPVHYVALNSSTPLAPYSSWATAATNIQDAIDAVSVPGALILVSNGVYQAGGRAVYGTMTNRVAVIKPLTLQSVNGPGVTLIHGYQTPGTRIGTGALRCVYLTNGATLVGFTLTNGATQFFDDERRGGGGGVWCESASAVVSNCTLTGNLTADQGGGGAYSGTLNNCTLTGNSVLRDGPGGGAYFATLNNCTLQSNRANWFGGGAGKSTLNNCTLVGNSVLQGYGGGAAFGTLNNCTLIGNSARDYGGGAAFGTLNNCIVYDNTGGNYGSDPWGLQPIKLNYCSTTPLPTNGTGNITNEPVFVDLAAGNFRLASNSPCINAGNNRYTPDGLDLDRHPRIAGGTVDIGAYEFQSPQSRMSFAWLQQHGLPVDGSEDGSDFDGDHLNNYQEWRAGTDPADAQSLLRLRFPLFVGQDLILTWESVPGRTYFLEGSTNLALPAFFYRVATNIPGEESTTIYTHTNAAGPGPWFYRVRVEE